LGSFQIQMYAGRDAVEPQYCFWVILPITRLARCQRTGGLRLPKSLYHVLTGLLVIIKAGTVRTTLYMNPIKTASSLKMMAE
jgi:hypothetical protein